MTSFYRTSAGAEIDLLLELSGGRGRLAIDIKRGAAERPERGFHHAREDVKSERSFVVHAGGERYPVSAEVEAVGLYELASALAELRQ